jgi:hypothetical protein
MHTHTLHHKLHHRPSFIADMDHMCTVSPPSALLLQCPCSATGLALSTRDRFLKQQRHSIELIVERICAAKSELYMWFSRCDAEKRGTVSKLEWAKALASVLKLQAVPWLSLSHLLVGMHSPSLGIPRSELCSTGSCAD